MARRFAPARCGPKWCGAFGAEIGIDFVSHPYDVHRGYPLPSTVIDKPHQTALYLAHLQLVLRLLYMKLRTGADFLRLATRSTENAIANNVPVFEAAREILRARAIVDSSKSYLKAFSLYLLHPDCVRILLLKRDGSAELSSDPKRGQPRKSAILDWQCQHKRALPLFRRHVPAKHVLQLTYESVTTDPRSTLRHVCEFVYLAFEEGMLDFRSKAHHVANGNRLHMSNSSEIKTDNEWQSRLTPDDLRSFERRAESLNRRLGYT